MRCDHHHGAGERCGALLVERLDRTLGRVALDCPACARRVRGLCRDCPRPVAGVIGRAVRCADCKAAKIREDKRRWRTRDPAKARAVQRRWWRTHRAERLPLAREDSRRRRDAKRGGPPMPVAEAARQRGYARAAKLSPARRSEIARLAVTARWARVRAERAA